MNGVHPIFSKIFTHQIFGYPNPSFGIVPDKPPVVWLYKDVIHVETDYKQNGLMGSSFMTRRRDIDSNEHIAITQSCNKGTVFNRVIKFLCLHSTHIRQDVIPTDIIMPYNESENLIELMFTRLLNYPDNQQDEIIANIFKQRLFQSYKLLIFFGDSAENPFSFRGLNRDVIGIIISLVRMLLEMPLGCH